MKTFLVRRIKYRNGRRIGKYVKVQANSKKAAMSKYLQRQGFQGFSIHSLKKGEARKAHRRR